MITWHMDLGQIIVSSLLLFATIIVWFIKKEINTFGKRLDKHDEVITNLVGDVQRLIGMSMNWNGENRRGHK